MSRLRKVGVAAATAALVVSVAACATPSESGKTELVFMAGVTPNITAEFWQSEIDLFEAEHPDITVRFLPSAAGQVENDLQTQIAAGTMPDVVLGISPLTFAEFLLPYDQSNSEYAKILGIEDNLVDGELYHLGPIASVTNLVFYNKSIFEEVGIEEEPADWASFDAAVEKIRNAGITPMLTAGEWVTGHNMVYLTPVLVEHPCWYADRAAGTVKFTDPEWLEGVDRFASLVADGDYNEGALGLTYPQVEQAFLAGEGAMYMMGNWFAGAANAAPPAFEIGVFPVPSDEAPGAISGAFGTGGYSISNTSKHPEAALEFSEFMVFNPEALAAYLNADGLLSNVDIPLDRELSPLEDRINEIVAAAPVKAAAVDGSGACPTPPGLWNEIQRVAQEVFLDPQGDHKALLAELDTYWDENFE